METERRAAWCSVTIHLQTSPAVQGRPYLAEDALLWAPPPRHLWTPGEGRRLLRGHPQPLRALCVALVQPLQWSEWSLAITHRRGRGPAGKAGWLWAWGEGGTWASQLLLVAVKGLDQRLWSLGLIARPLATVLCVPARSGIVLQQPAVHSVLPEASGSHQPLRSQVPQLAKGRQLLAC